MDGPTHMRLGQQIAITTVLAKTTSFLGVTGKLQAEDGVTHVIAESFWVPTLRARPASGGSHDFH